jgi:hypothetical protein
MKQNPLEDLLRDVFANEAKQSSAKLVWSGSPRRRRRLETAMKKAIFRIWK